MSLTYQWKIREVKTVDTADFANTVIQTYWTLTGTDENGVEGSFVGATPLDTSGVTAETFVPYDQLTEEVMVSWIKAVVDGNPAYKAHIDERIMKAIAQKSHKTVDLPWVINIPNTAPPVSNT